MWPLQKESNKLISCVFTPHSIGLTLFANNTPNKPSLVDHTIIQCHSAELEWGIPCNRSFIKKTIQAFISQHNAHNASFQFALSGPLIKEKITNKKTSIEGAQYKTYLYTLGTKHFYYTLQIEKALLMGYQLLAIELAIDLNTITTPFIAYLKLYQHIHDKKFAHTQLAQDLRQHSHRIEYLFEGINLHDYLDIKNHHFTIAKEHSFLLVSLGLKYLRR